MRISDWSSDVCSSDLADGGVIEGGGGAGLRIGVSTLSESCPVRTEPGNRCYRTGLHEASRGDSCPRFDHAVPQSRGSGGRSEERRGGKECVSTGRFRGEPVQ